MSVADVFVSSKQLRRPLLGFLVWFVAAESITVVVTTYLASALYYRLAFTEWPPAGYYMAASFCIAATVLAVSLVFRHYSGLQVQPQHRFMWNGFGAVVLAFSLFLSILFILKSTSDYSRGSFVFQLLAVSGGVLVVRGVFHRFIQSAVAAGVVEARRAVVFGTLDSRQPIISSLQASGVIAVAFFPLPALVGQEVRQVVESCRAHQPDDILLLTRPEELSRIALFTIALSEIPAAVHIVPVGLEDTLPYATLGQLGKLTTVQVLHRPLSLADQVIKRVFDFVVAATASVVLMPLLALTAAAIKLNSRGPAIFSQTRHGYNNKTIRVFKFRTMTTLEDGYEFRQATRHDPRITRAGRILRRTNIDELPQLGNVLRGEMSIVGPRPHPIALNATFVDQLSRFSRRHNVKPGITGWAQVHGFRGETDTTEKMRRRVEHDLYYIDNWSLLLDLKIIMMTLFSRRAYMNAG